MTESFEGRDPTIPFLLGILFLGVAVAPRRKAEAPPAAQQSTTLLTPDKMTELSAEMNGLLSRLDQYRDTCLGIHQRVLDGQIESGVFNSESARGAEMAFEDEVNERLPEFHARFVPDLDHWHSYFGRDDEADELISAAIWQALSGWRDSLFRECRRISTQMLGRHTAN